MRSLCVEGWRFLHHSFALVNQWQLLSLLKRNDVSLTVCDLPYFQPDWISQKGLFDPEQESKLESIPTRSLNESSDATLRISYPYDFSLKPAGRTILFFTSEFHHFGAHVFKLPPDVKELSRSESFLLVTPSRWAREGLFRLGFRAEQIVIVSHGVDPITFRPSTKGKAYREALKLPGFTFANASAMTGNKGIDLLLRAFAIVAEKHPDTRLLLKGADDLHKSHDRLLKTIASLPAGVANHLEGRILYGGGAVTMAAMSEFYQTADAYVSSYRGEGFNLPVLEASACGTPVICTKGGSTDDFMNDDTARFIESRVVDFVRGRVPGCRLEPDLDHLVDLMFQVMDDREWRERAARVGPERAATEFAWDIVVDKLVNAIYDVR